MRNNCRERSAVKAIETFSINHLGPMGALAFLLMAPFPAPARAAFTFNGVPVEAVPSVSSPAVDRGAGNAQSQESRYLAFHDGIVRLRRESMKQPFNADTWMVDAIRIRSDLEKFLSESAHYRGAAIFFHRNIDHDERISAVNTQQFLLSEWMNLILGVAHRLPRSELDRLELAVPASVLNADPGLPMRLARSVLGKVYEPALLVDKGTGALLLRVSETYRMDRALRARIEAPTAEGAVTLIRAAFVLAYLEKLDDLCRAHIGEEGKIDECAGAWATQADGAFDLAAVFRERQAFVSESIYRRELERRLVDWIDLVDEFIDEQGRAMGLDMDESDERLIAQLREEMNRTHEELHALAPRKAEILLRQMVSRAKAYWAAEVLEKRVRAGQADYGIARSWLAARSASLDSRALQTGVGENGAGAGPLSERVAAAAEAVLEKIGFEAEMDVGFETGRAVDELIQRIRAWESVRTPEDFRGLAEYPQILRLREKMPFSAFSDLIPAEGGQILP